MYLTLSLFNSLIVTLNVHKLIISFNKSYKNKNQLIIKI